MKTRKGFVSNSSSTSFCMYGTTFSYDDIKVYMKKIGMTMEDEEEDLGFWVQEHYDKFPGLAIFSEYENETCYIGRLWKYIGDDETGSQLKKDVENNLKKCFGEEFECGTIDETIYND